MASKGLSTNARSLCPSDVLDEIFTQALLPSQGLHSEWIFIRFTTFTAQRGRRLSKEGNNDGQIQINWDAFVNVLSVHVSQSLALEIFFAFRRALLVLAGFLQHNGLHELIAWILTRARGILRVAMGTLDALALSGTFVRRQF